MNKSSYFKEKDDHVKPTQVCVPLTSKNFQDLSTETLLVVESRPDFVEWRVDNYNYSNCQELLKAAQMLSTILGKTPVIFTFRSHRDGGKEISDQKYINLIEWAIESGLFELIDVEISLGKEVVTCLGEKARNEGLEVILSYHNFEKTPLDKELLEIFDLMKQIGEGVFKIAVMPSSKQDVLRLMQLGLSYSQENPHQPIVLISMGELGKISRLCSDFYGSAMTFATVSSQSAPGQLSVQQVKAFLEL